MPGAWGRESVGRMRGMEGDVSREGTEPAGRPLVEQRYRLPDGRVVDEHEFDQWVDRLDNPALIVRVRVVYTPLRSPRRSKPKRTPGTHE